MRSSLCLRAPCAFSESIIEGFGSGGECVKRFSRFLAVCPQTIMLRKALAALLLALVCLSGFASANRLFLSTEEFVAQHSGPVRSLQGAGAWGRQPPTDKDSCT